MSRNRLEGKDFKCWFLHQSSIVRMSVRIKNVKYASKTQNKKFKLKPNTSILTCVVHFFFKLLKMTLNYVEAPI